MPATHGGWWVATSPRLRQAATWRCRTPLWTSSRLAWSRRGWPCMPAPASLSVRAPWPRWSGSSRAWSSCRLTPEPRPPSAMRACGARRIPRRPTATDREGSTAGWPGGSEADLPGNLTPMTTPRFEETRPKDYLLRLAASDLGRVYKSLAVTELGIRRGDTVLDLGCGPGADLAAFAEATGREGRVIGVDNDPAAVAEAASRTAGVPQVEVVQGDVHALDIPDASVDRVHTDRVLQHVGDAAAVLREARRVVRTGGSAVFAEPDWDTL